MRTKISAFFTIYLAVLAAGAMVGLVIGCSTATDPKTPSSSGPTYITADFRPPFISVGTSWAGVIGAEDGSSVGSLAAEQLNSERAAASAEELAARMSAQANVINKNSGEIRNYAQLVLLRADDPTTSENEEKLCGFADARVAQGTGIAEELKLHYDFAQGNTVGGVTKQNYHILLLIGNESAPYKTPTLLMSGYLQFELSNNFDNPPPIAFTMIPIVNKIDLYKVGGNKEPISSEITLQNGGAVTVPHFKLEKNADYRIRYRLTYPVGDGKLSTRTEALFPLKLADPLIRTGSQWSSRFKDESTGLMKASMIQANDLATAPLTLDGEKAKTAHFSWRTATNGDEETPGGDPIEDVAGGESTTAGVFEFPFRTPDVNANGVFYYTALYSPFERPDNSEWVDAGGEYGLGPINAGGKHFRPVWQLRNGIANESGGDNVQDARTSFVMEKRAYTTEDTNLGAKAFNRSGGVKLIIGEGYKEENKWGEEPEGNFENDTTELGTLVLEEVIPNTGVGWYFRGNDFPSSLSADVGGVTLRLSNFSQQKRVFGNASDIPTPVRQWVNASRLRGATPVAGGTGYAVGDELTVPHGTLKVTAVGSSGEVTGLSVKSRESFAGTRETNPVPPSATTSAGGTGCTVNLTYEDSMLYTYPKEDDFAAGWSNYDPENDSSRFIEMKISFNVNYAKNRPNPLTFAYTDKSREGAPTLSISSGDLEGTGIKPVMNDDIDWGEPITDADGDMKPDTKASLWRMEVNKVNDTATSPYRVTLYFTALLIGGSANLR